MSENARNLKPTMLFARFSQGCLTPFAPCSESCYTRSVRERRLTALAQAEVSPLRHSGTSGVNPGTAVPSLVDQV